MTENELLKGYGLLKRHCSRVLREHALAWPCAEQAVVIFVMDDGVRMGFCKAHRVEGEAHAKFRGWKAEVAA